MSRLKPNDQRAKVAVILIWIVMSISIITIISCYFQNVLLKKALRGESISSVVANSNDMRQSIIVISFLVFYIISAFTFIMWFRRAYFNLHLKVKNLAHSEGWAAGSWFVPLMNLGRPFNIMKELFYESTRVLERAGVSEKKEVNFNLISLWWGLWIFEGISDRALARYSKDHQQISELIFATNWEIVNSLVMIPLAIVTIKVIKNYSIIEEKLRLLPLDSANQKIILGDNDLLDSGF